MPPKLKLVLSKGRLKQLTKSLRLGDILYGKVLRRINQERYLMEFQGQDVVASFQGLLKRGSSIKTIVQSLSPQIVLKFYQQEKLLVPVKDLVEYYKKVIRKNPTGLSLDPALPEMLQELFLDFDETVKAASKKKALKQLQSEMYQFFQQTFLDSAEFSKGSIENLIQKKIRARFKLPLPMILHFEKMVNEYAKEEEKIHEKLDDIGQGLKKLYLNLSIEQFYLSEFFEGNRKTSFFQLPILKSSLLQNLNVHFYQEKPSLPIYVRLKYGEELPYFDFSFEKGKRGIVFYPFERGETRGALNLFLRLLEARKVPIRIEKDETQIFARVFGVIAQPLELLKPVNFNVLA